VDDMEAAGMLSGPWPRYAFLKLRTFVTRRVSEEKNR
jgi:hypothetical protein